VVSQRLGMLSEDCQQLLALASVVGREFSTEVLATASGGDSARVVDDLQEAVLISMLVAVPTLQATTVSRTSWFARCFTTNGRPLVR
jgi:predicted ATPase